METQQHDTPSQPMKLTLTASGRLLDHCGQAFCPASLEPMAHGETVEIMLDAAHLGTNQLQPSPASSLSAENAEFLPQSTHFELVDCLPQENGHCLLQYRKTV